MSQSNAQRREPTEETESATRRPVDTARVGNVEIAIWRNHGANGEFYTASAPTLRYKEKEEEGGEWKDSNSYGPVDLLTLAEAAREASAKIRELSKGRGQRR